MPIWLKRDRPDIGEWICEQTKSYCTTSMLHRVHLLLHGPAPMCSDGNERMFKTFTDGYRLTCHLGAKCKDFTLAREQNMLRIYGVTNSSHIEGHTEKVKKTNIEKYGTEWSSQNDKVKEKTKKTRTNKTEKEKSSQRKKTVETNRRRYGVDYPMQSTDFKQRVYETNVERYGYRTPLESPLIKDKMVQTRAKLDKSTINQRTKNTCNIRYETNHGSQKNLTDLAKKVLLDEAEFRNYAATRTRDEVMKSLNICYRTLNRYCHLYDAFDLFLRPVISKFEQEMMVFLTDLNVEFVQQTRSVIDGELDFYLPKHNIAIECCGLYWHSELSAKRYKLYHSQKYEKCKEIGIQLITIFQDEWTNKHNQVISILKNLLLPNKPIAARKCVVKEISCEDADNFIDQHHIQGIARAKVNFGLFYDDELVSVMTFDRPRFSKKAQYELVRYCSKLNIMGGASKLLTAFEKKYIPTSIVSYSDNRWFSGRMYESLGFTNGGTTIGYTYTDYKERYNRYKFQKHKLVQEGYDASLSEWEIMQSRGYDRIWDCGQVVWTK